MATSNTSQARYSMGAIILHWVIAIAVIVNWRLAETGHHLEGAAAAAYMNPHKALGITILFLTVLRIIWRLMNPPPAMHSDYAKWERMLAKTAHVLFYFLLIGIPLTGWLAVSSYGKTVDIFGLFEMFALPVAENPSAGKSILAVHETLWTGMSVLIVLHILGALKHQFYDKTNELGRMIPGLGKR